MTLTPKAAFDPGLSSEWNELLVRLSAAENAHSTLDALRVTTAGAFLGATATDPIESTKFRSALVTVNSGFMYRFHGQTLYSAVDPWALEIRKGSAAGPIIGGARLDAGGGNLPWNVTWPCAATETTQFYYMLNRLSGVGTIALFAVNDGFHNTFVNVDLVGVAATLRDVP
jgi:hypothetical protein